MTGLEALVVAAYVFADEYPVAARGGRKPLVSDAELVALAVAQAAIGISSDRQFLGLINRVLPGWFPHLPDQSQYNRRLRALVELISIVQQQLARWLDTGGIRLADGTSTRGRELPPVASSDPSSPASLATATQSRTTALSGASCSTRSPAVPHAPSPPTTAAKSHQASSTVGRGSFGSNGDDDSECGNVRDR